MDVEYEMFGMGGICVKKILALALALTLLAGLLAGCSGKAGSGIQARAFGSDETLTLNVKADVNSGDFVSYGGYQFESGKKLDAMQKLIIKNNEGVSGALFENEYGPCWLFTKEDGSVTHYWCLYQKEPLNIKDWYIFVGAHRELRLNGQNYDLLLPLHLISDSYLRDNMANRLELDTAYACGLTETQNTMQELFYSFYASSGLYTVTGNEQGFLLTGRQSGAQQLQFSFDESGGTGWFTISVPVPEEPEPSAVASVEYGVGEDALTRDLPENDALALSEMLLNANFSGDPASMPASEPSYTAIIGDDRYGVDLVWTDNTWDCGIFYGDSGYATFTTEQACRVAGIFGANRLFTPDESVSDWPADLDTEITPMGACMIVTATSLNVRSFPSTNGGILQSLPQNTAVAVCGKTANNWYEIVLNGIYAYVSADYLVTPTTKQ